jgi:predicted secreted protein
MKTTISTLMVLALMAGILIACMPAAADPINIGEQDANKTIELKTGETLVVSLDGNITTGFNWVPGSQNPALLKQVGEAEVTPASNLLGAAGKIVLKFEAAAKGQTILHLDYKRPWEQNTPPEKTFEVIVVVK